MSVCMFEGLHSPIAISWLIYLCMSDTVCTPAGQCMVSIDTPGGNTVCINPHEQE